MNHKFQFCEHCDRMMVVCGSCGNNTCNGGFGEVIGREKVDGEIVMVACPDCESAYELDKISG